MKNGRKNVTLARKANILKFTQELLMEEGTKSLWITKAESCAGIDAGCLVDRVGLT